MPLLPRPVTVLSLKIEGLQSLTCQVDDSPSSHLHYLPLVERAPKNAHLPFHVEIQPRASRMGTLMAWGPLNFLLGHSLLRETSPLLQSKRSLLCLLDSIKQPRSLLLFRPALALTSLHYKIRMELRLLFRYPQGRILGLFRHPSPNRLRTALRRVRNTFA